MRLRFAGPALARAFAPAFAPRQVPTGSSVDIDISVWDTATAGTPLPPAPWRLRDVIARGDVLTFSGARIRTLVDTGNESLTMWDGETRRGIFWVADPARVPWWQLAAPLRSILHWGLAGPRRHLLHAGAVGDERGALLLVGRSGSGKSTTALACLDAGLGYIADDYILADLDGGPMAFGLYGTAKLSLESVALLPGLAHAPRVVDPASGEPKVVIDVGRHRRDALRRVLPIAGIVLPRVTTGPLRLRRAGAADALRALAPSTILQHAHESAGGLAVMSELVRRVPAYGLELGDDVAAVAPAVRALLATRG